MRILLYVIGESIVRPSGHYIGTGNLNRILNFTKTTSKLNLSTSGASQMLQQELFFLEGLKKGIL